MKAIIGTKKEMTNIYGEEGKFVPCTIVDVSDVRVVGKREMARDGYDALILGKGKKKKATKAEVGKYKKLKYVPRYVFEFRSSGEDLEKYKIGDEVKADIFKENDTISASGKTKGKGFAGVIKRWHFKGGSRTHGQSDRERHGGSIGAGTDPGRVFKGKKMPGHMGDKTKNILGLKVVKVDSENDLLCIKGSLPGSRNSILKIVQK